MTCHSSASMGGGTERRFAAYAAWRRSARVAVGYTLVMSQQPLSSSTLLAIARAADLALAAADDAT
jgi:hypothetical protein